MIYIWFLLGLIIIVKSSDVFLDSAIWLATTFKVPEIIVGATIVSICTVLPEEVISLSAALHQDSGLAFGNAAGSMMCNVGVVLAFGLIINPPVLSFVKGLKKNAFILIAILISVIFSFILTGYIGRSFGIALLCIFVWYLWENSQNSIVMSVGSVRKGKLGIWLILLVGSALGIALGSQLLVHNGEKIAVALGVPNLIIGLTLTAIGSSLPEFVTCIASITKGVADISVGNIIGANILNAALVLGSAATAYPIYIDKTAALFNLFYTLIMAAYILVCFHRKDKRLYRSDGFILLAMYCVFLIASIKLFA